MLGYLLRLLAGADQPHHGVVERRAGPRTRSAAAYRLAATASMDANAGNNATLTTERRGYRSSGPRPRRTLASARMASVSTSVRHTRAYGRRGKSVTGSQRTSGMAQ
jgi:hypothetical protein